MLLVVHLVAREDFKKLLHEYQWLKGMYNMSFCVSSLVNWKETVKAK